MTAPTDEAKQLARVLVFSAEEVAKAVRGLRSMKNAQEILKRCVEINRLENEADTLLRLAVGKLFKTERDPLTGVLKRGGILAQFEKARELADPSRANLALINLDIDEFDSINKQYGHYTGDEVLRRVARSLVNNFKGIGHVGRYAGDEFVVLLPDSRAETAFVLAEEVRRAIEDTPIEVTIGEQKNRLTAAFLLLLLMDITLS